MKKIITSAAFLLAAQMYVFSQSPAPDFTVTDAHGVQHNLHADYLDKGITVIIDLFFTSCPPCNAKAPAVQQMYEDWGEGKNDLQIIELSTSSSDTDAKLLAYETKHGLTFPGVSPDGGSLTASQPYRTSGNFFGTPGFIVVAPTSKGRTTEWVYNNSNLITNLEAAVTRTGAVKPVQLTTVSGKVLTTTGRPIPNVKVYLENHPLNYSMTDNNGNYSLALELDDGIRYHLIGEKTGDLVADGISTLDLLHLTRDLLNTVPLSDHNKLAADLNNDDKLSTLDLVMCRRIILKTVIDLPGRSSNWDFYSPNLSNPGFNTSLVLNAINLVGVKFGDLDDSTGL